MLTNFSGCAVRCFVGVFVFFLVLVFAFFFLLHLGGLLLRLRQRLRHFTDDGHHRHGLLPGEIPLGHHGHAGGCHFLSVHRVSHATMPPRFPAVSSFAFPGGGCSKRSHRRLAFRRHPG